MAQHIYTKNVKGKVYFYLQETFREKLDPLHAGKAPGSGKSRVVTKSTYLGTEAAIIRKLQQTAQPIEVRPRAFGWVAAIYQVAEKIGLVALLKKHIGGERFGLPRWLYFFLTIINRLDAATSKAKMGDWAATTILPELLAFSPAALNSQAFWYATDDVLSEKELRQTREAHPELSDQLMAGLDESLWQKMEEELLELMQRHGYLSMDTLLYDTTNFFTYIEEPARSWLARAGHNKDSRHHLKQVGLALAIDKQSGIPFFHRLYRGNRQDAKTFSDVIGELIERLQKSGKEVAELVLVLDKGNNSEENFAKLQGKIHWVGSLVLSHYTALQERPLSEYPNTYRLLRYVTETRAVMGVTCLLVLTYNERLARKQEHTLQRGIEKLKTQIRQRWQAYKKPPTTVPAGIKTLLKKSRYGKLLTIGVENKAPVFSLVEEQLQAQRKHFGKNLLFTSRAGVSAEWVIDNYRAKNKVEQDFHWLKAPELIRFRPIRHWTDTKIRAFGFCCVAALLVLRIMLLMTERARLKMSAVVLKEELSDLKQFVLIYSPTQAQTQTSRRSSVQQKLWDLFDLAQIERQLTIHTMQT